MNEIIDNIRSRIYSMVDDMRLKIYSWIIREPAEGEVAAQEWMDWLHKLSPCKRTHWEKLLDKSFYGLK